jgi:MoaA/NifB/PqqE/SkfB family radical SAM enzyme
MSKSYCAKLWNHQYVHMSGSLRYCCATMENLKDKKGNRLHINNDSLENVWNSHDIKEARLKMMRGEPVPACVKCVEQEERGYQSMRDERDMALNFVRTEKDGSVGHAPSSIELHLGNLCNLKCKMCGQQYSNQIGKELLEIGKEDPDFLEWIRKESGNVNIWTNNLSVEYRWFQNKKIKNKLFNYIANHITDMVVIGGEPTVIPEFWELFEYLEQRGRLNNMSITLTTNLTNVNPKMTNWLPRLKSWTVWASVDGLGERTEYIRYPSNFKKVCDNLDFYKGLLANNNGKIVLSPAIQLLNIDQLDDILRWWLDFSGGDLSDKFGVSWMAQVWYPTICNYDILPIEHKERIADKLERAVPEFEAYKEINTWYKNQIDNLRKDNYTEEQKKHFIKAFIRYNDSQDRHRKSKSWRQLMPDLEQALTKSIG